MKQKILLIILGLFIAILLCEGLFRIGGLLANKNQYDINKNKKVYRILCVGDSSTYGTGASDRNKFSYPSQLQNILNDKFINKKFEVINLGRPGISSSQLLNRFENDILKFKPNIAVMMIGINDPWNFEESNILKFYNMKPRRPLFIRIELLLSQSKLYKFLKLVVLSVKFKEPKVPCFNCESRDETELLFAHDPARAKALNSAIINNISRLKQISEDNNIKIIFMKYHNTGWGNPELIIYPTYTQLKVPVVDNEILFKKAKQQGLNVLGNDEWHPNDLGYSLIAENIFNKMVELKILDTEPIAIFE